MRMMVVGLGELECGMVLFCDAYCKEGEGAMHNGWFLRI